jgi:hypothetical protein
MLLYVHQNVEIVKLGYSLNEKQKNLSEYSDQNRKLLCQINSLESPEILSRMLGARNGNLIETDAKNVCYASLKYSRDNFPAGAGKEKAIDRFLDVFTQKAEAKPRK